MRVQKGLLAESYLIGRPSVLRSKQELQPAMENKNATFVLRHFRIWLETSHRMTETMNQTKENISKRVGCLRRKV